MALTAEQYAPNQSMMSSHDSSAFTSERNGSVYGNVHIAPNARVHLGDVIQYVQATNDPKAASLPSQALLDDFVQSNIELVERFDMRMYALKSSIENDNAAKSQALRNIGDEIRNLEFCMTRNRNKLEQARQSHDTYTAETTDAGVRILMAMNQALHSVLEALATSLETQSRTEAERLEKEKMLREIEDSRQNLSNSVDMACDSLQAAGKVMQVLPGSQRPEMQRAGKIMDNSAFVGRMFKKVAAFANKGGDDERQPGGNYNNQQRSQPYPMRNARPISQQQRGSGFEPNRYSRTSPIPHTSATSEDSADDPSERPGLPPRRPKDAGLSMSQHSTPLVSVSDDINSAEPTQSRSRILGDSDGWELTHLPPPPTRISRSPQSTSVRPNTTRSPFLTPSNELSRVVSAPQTSSTSRATPPPLPARAPALPPRPPRPGAPNREILSDPGPSSETGPITSLSENAKLKNADTSSQTAPLVNSSIKSELSLRLASLGQANGQKVSPISSVMSTPSQKLPVTSFPKPYSSLPPSPPLSLSPPPSAPSSPPSINSRPAIPTKPKRLASTVSKAAETAQNPTWQILRAGESTVSKEVKAETSTEEATAMTFAQKKAMFGGVR